MRFKVHYQKEIMKYFSLYIVADNIEDAEQRIRDSIKNESWYNVELDIPRRSILEDQKTIKIVDNGILVVNNI